MNRLLILLIVVATAHAAIADEGLWTFDAFPKNLARESLGFSPDDAWLKHVRSAVVEVGACSGTFVSPSGLILTGQKCVEGCLDSQSVKRRGEARFAGLCRSRGLREALPLFDLFYCSPLERDEAHDFTKSGFMAGSSSAELSCPRMKVDLLVATIDVTKRYEDALAAAKDLESKHLVSRQFTDECQAGDEKIRCEVSELYGGAKALLYRYQRFADVRLVFAAEAAVAHFGEPDESSTFPRHAFPVAFIRVYQNDQPLVSPSYLRLSNQTQAEGTPVFLVGSPGSSERVGSVDALGFEASEATQRLMLVGQLRATFEALRERYPNRLIDEELTLFQEMMNEQRAVTRAIDSKLLRQSSNEERRDREQLAKRSPGLLSGYDAARATEGANLAAFEAIWRGGMNYVEGDRFGDVFDIAKLLARYASEQPRPSSLRQLGFADSELPRMREAVLRPLHRDLAAERELLAFRLRTTADDLGPRHELTKTLLGNQTAEALASDLINRTKLQELQVRQALWDGGPAAIESSNDPLLAFARRVNDVGRQASDELNLIGERLLDAERTIARILFAAGLASSYPDGDNTLRIGFGRIKGYELNGSSVQAFSSLAGSFGYATSRPPYLLPERWLKAKELVDLSLPLAFAADTDGGFWRDYPNSEGGPMLNAAGEVVGMAFAGNEDGIGARYRFRPNQTRAIAVHGAAILHILDKVYGDAWLDRELQAPLAAIGTKN